MPQLALPPPIRERRSDEREVFRLINALRRQFLNSRFTRVIGPGTGEITLGAATGLAIEFRDGEGTSLGVIPLLSFVVNP